MHGLIGKALDCFLTDAHGATQRDAVLKAAGLPPDGFLSTRCYAPSSLRAVLLAASERLGLQPSALLLDLGMWLVSRPRTESLRRLVRFGAADFRGLIHSLEDLPARGRLAVPDLDLPRIEVVDRNPVYELRTEYADGGAGWVMTGFLRAMADDYGVLALVDYRGMRRIPGGFREEVRVEVADESHTPGRRFDLAPLPAEAA